MASTSLIIVGKSLDPDAITRLLKLKPSRQWRKGERKSFQRKDGTLRYFDSIHGRGGWKLWSTDAQRKKEISSQIARWVALLTKKKKELAVIRRSGCEIFLDCCIIGESDMVSLKPKMIQRMARLGLTFEATYFASLEKQPNQSPQRNAPTGPASSHSASPLAPALSSEKSRRHEWARG